jgi:protein phosphatase
MDLVAIQTPKYITGYAESRIGGRSENQDSYGYSETPFGFLITVCDGMGGGPGGKTASSIAVEEIIKGVVEGNKDDTLSNILIKSIRRANLAIIAKGKEVPRLQGMGSTCTVVLINEDCAVIAHVGDSRVYQLRGKSKVFRTFDHSMVFDMVRQGVITEEQARLSAQSNVITRALGIKTDIEVDVSIRPYQAGDRFMLCSDGIHGTMPEPDLIAYATDRKHPLGAVVDGLATTVDGKGHNEGGGHDNLTLAIVETNINSKLKEKMSKNVKISLIALSVICVISLIVNAVTLTHKAPTNEELEQTVARTDSLNNVLNDSIKHLGDTITAKDKAFKKIINELKAKDAKIEKLTKEANKK